MTLYPPICLLLCGLVSVGLLGCGGDDDPLEDLVGSWELIEIDRKTPEAYFEGDGNYGKSQGVSKF